jgi:hypothetical protein
MPARAAAAVQIRWYVYCRGYAVNIRHEATLPCCCATLQTGNTNNVLEGFRIVLRALTRTATCGGEAEAMSGLARSVITCARVCEPCPTHTPGSHTFVARFMSAAAGPKGRASACVAVDGGGGVVATVPRGGPHLCFALQRRRSTRTFSLQ